MSNYTKHLIIYSPENVLVATRLSHALQSAGNEAMILEKSKDDFSEQLGQIALPPATEAVFLLTDNFLKSYGCMNGVLQATHNWGDAGRLTVIVTDGAALNEEGEPVSVATKFERVGEIIQYMNYWQDKYLGLRKEKRSRPNDEILAEKIAITKEISGDVGEYLRYIRGMSYQSLEQFYEKNKLNPELPIEEEVEKEIPIEEVADSPADEAAAEKSLVQIIKDSSEEIIAENSDAADEIADEAAAEAITDEVLSAIPSMDQLADNAGENEKTAADEPAKKNEMKLKDFTKKEMRKLDDENDELMTILDEVMVEEGLSEGDGAVSVPDEEGDFDIDSLFNDIEEDVAPETVAEPANLNKDEVVLSIVEEEPGEELTSDEILEQAVEYFREEQMDEGITHLEEAVAVRPNDTSLRYYLGYALARYASDYEKAESELNTLLNVDNEHPDAWFLKGELLENKQDFENAKNCFERVVEINPSFPDAHYRLGLLLDEQFDADEKAAEHLKEAIQQNEKNADAHYMLASLMSEKMDEPEKAVKHFRKAINLYPNHPFANYDLALVYHSLKDRERAAEFYEKAVAVNAELKTEQNDLAFGLSSVAEAEESVATSENGHTDSAVELEIANDPEMELLMQQGEEDIDENTIIGEETIEEIISESADTAVPDGMKAEGISEESAVGEETIEEIISQTPEEAPIATMPTGVEEMGLLDGTVSEEITVGEESLEEIVDEIPVEEAGAEVAAKMASVPDSLDEFASVAAIPVALTIMEDKEEDEEIEEPTPPKVDTKVVLITGATSGIGKATAEIFAKNGYRIIMTGRREDRLKELSESFSEEHNADCHTISFDVRDTRAVKAAIENLPEEWKNIDILINNAGLSRGLEPIHEGNLDDWETMIDTNVKGLLYMTRAIAPYMVGRKSGHIINVSSISGTEVYPGGNVYSASKAAVSSLTRSMRLDLTKHNIRVSQISPGHVEETEFARVRFDGDTAKAAKVYENFQPLTSSDVADTLYFIATRPPHVNIVDIYMYGTQQANATTIERTGR